MDNRHPIRVMIADSQIVVRAGLRLFLEQSGDVKIVAEAGDGEAALRLIHTTSPDLIILDLPLPKINGVEVIRQIRATYPQINTLIFTASEDEIYINAFLKSGASGYLLKQATPEEILLAVREIACGKSYIDKTVLQKIISQASAPQPVLEQLSERETEILAHVARGMTNKAIAAKLSISDRTVQGHIARIFEKLNAASRTDAVMRAIAHGYIQSPDSKPEEVYLFEI